MADQAKLKKRLEALVKLPENTLCADCRKRGPRWASANLGVFMCIECSGIHRGLGVHISFVRSVNLDTWTKAQVDFMEEWGNERANALYEANIPANYTRPKETDNIKVIERFIRDKYEAKRFMGKSAPPPKAHAVAEAPQQSVPVSKPVSVAVSTPAKAAPAPAAINLLDFNDPVVPATPPPVPVHSFDAPAAISNDVFAGFSNSVAQSQAVQHTQQADPNVFAGFGNAPTQEVHKPNPMDILNLYNNGNNMMGHNSMMQGNNMMNQNHMMQGNNNMMQGNHMIQGNMQGNMGHGHRGSINGQMMQGNNMMMQGQGQVHNNTMHQNHQNMQYNGMNQMNQNHMMQGNMQGNMGHGHHGSINGQMMPGNNMMIQGQGQVHNNMMHQNHQNMQYNGMNQMNQNHMMQGNHMMMQGNMQGNMSHGHHGNVTGQMMQGNHMMMHGNMQGNMGHGHHGNVTGQMMQGNNMMMQGPGHSMNQSMPSGAPPPVPTTRPADNAFSGLTW